MKRQIVLVILLILLGSCATCQDLFDVDRQPHPEEAEP